MGLAQILAKLDVSAGGRIVYVGDVRRQPNGGWLIERYLLVNETARRLEPLQLTEKEIAFLPRPECVYLEGRRDMRISSPFPTLRSLHPVVHYEPDPGRLFFLNARRGKKQVEYLCYTTGEVLVRDIGNDQRKLLSLVLNQPIDPAAAEVFATRSLAEERADGAPEPLPVGRAIGEFELLSRLGQGGMGVVYRAWQPSLGRQVALKCMLRSAAPKAEARFTREIRALGQIEHPNVIKAFTSGAQGEQWFYAMELIEGVTLAAVCEKLQSQSSQAASLDLPTWQGVLSTVCEEARKAETPLIDGRGFRQLGVHHVHSSPQENLTSRSYVQHVAVLIRQAADGAHALHERGVVHRDIKPGNITVDADGCQAILMDLGLAQLADQLEGKLTRTRQFVGTLRYASPEQVLAVSPVDCRSDVYSLGATLWELLTLRPLFGATEHTPTPELMQRIQHEEPDRIRKYNQRVPKDLEAIVLKCLEKDPARRYVTALQFSEDLQRFINGDTVLARPVGKLRRVARSVRRRPALTALIVMVVMVLGAAMGVFS
jgi:serine/threonine protein kinase